MQCDTFSGLLTRKTLQTSIRFTTEDWAAIDWLKAKTGLATSSLIKLALHTLRNNVQVKAKKPPAKPRKKGATS